MSTYLDRLRGQHNETRARIEAVMAKATGEDRELTEDEMRSVTEDGAKAAALADQIEPLHEQETRAAKVAALAPVEQVSTETRSAGGATTRDRDPGHYRSAEEGGTRSFFRDVYKAGTGDWTARERLNEHNRANLGLGTGASATSTSVGSGAVPPKYLADQFLTLSRAGRVVADRVTPLELGDDPRPIVLPEQTTGTDAVVGTPATEGAPPSNTDAYATAGRTLTPAPITGEQVVSRQLLDSASPAIDQLIFNDLNAVYDEKAEALVVAAIVAAATAGTTFSTEAGFYAAANPVTPTAAVLAGLDAFVDAQTAVWTNSKRSANIQVISAHRWGVIRKMRDNELHPIIPAAAYNTLNVAGRGTNPSTPNGLVADFESLQLYVSHALDVALGQTESSLVFRSDDVVLAEGNEMEFTFQEVKGPHQIVLGIWRYAGALVRRNGVSAQKIVVTTTS